jgi:hypothetical protein
MDTQHPMSDFVEQLTSEEKLQLVQLLISNDVFHIEEKFLAPNHIQAKQLKIMQAQYQYQTRLLERDMACAVAEELDDYIARIGKASGAVEVITYLINLSLAHNPQQSDIEGE